MKRQARCARERHIPFPSLGAVAHLEHPLCGGYRMPQPRGRGVELDPICHRLRAQGMSSRALQVRFAAHNWPRAATWLVGHFLVHRRRDARGLGGRSARRGRGVMWGHCRPLAGPLRRERRAVRASASSAHRASGAAYRARGGELVHLVHLGVRNRARALRRLARRLGTGPAGCRGDTVTRPGSCRCA